MGLLDPLRRLSRVAPPQVIELPENELPWPSVKALSISIPTLEPPELSRDFVLRQPDTIEISVLGEPKLIEWVAPRLDQPQIIDLDANLLLPPFQIVDLLDPLARPVAHGTIYVKKEEQLRPGGQFQTQPRVGPLG